MIKEANPHVDLEKLEPGTAITVPEGLPGVKVEPEPAVVFLPADPGEPVGVLPSRGKVELDALAAAARSAKSRGATSASGSRRRSTRRRSRPR